MIPLPRPLRGIVPPLATPLAGPDELDVPGLERLIEHVLAAGATGLFMLGTTGEGPSLSYRLRRELIERTCTQARGRVPVLVCITDSSVSESLHLADHAARAGAAAVVASNPFYFRAGDGELMRWIGVLTSRLPLPLFLYNMPAFTKASFSQEVVRQAIEMPEVVGYKDSSGDMAVFHAVLRLAARRPDWTVLMGPEQLMADGVLFGAHGGVCGGANLFPRLFVSLYEAAARGDLAAVVAMQQDVTQLGQAYRVSRADNGFIKGLKCALASCGLCPETMAEPFEAFNESDRDRVRRLTADLATRWGE